MSADHQTASRARVLELNTAAAAFFASRATPGSTGRTYLDERVGAAALAAGSWVSGYAPGEWTALTNHLRRQGVTAEEIVEAGLGFRTSRGRVVDMFRERAMLAVRDLEGSVVGFVGRDLTGDGAAPKYLNTGSTVAYCKGDHLLGLYEARLQTGAPSSPANVPGTANWPRLVRVEGPFDAIAITAAGEGRYAGIAPLGTALTDRQANQLVRHIQASPSRDERIWLALDGDRAGRAAAEKDHWLLHARGLDPRVLHVPNHADPAQLWRDDHRQLRQLLEAADAAPPSGIVVIDNAIDHLAEQLADGDARALEELAAVHDTILAGLHRDDHDLLVAYTSSAVAGLTFPHRNRQGETQDFGRDAAPPPPARGPHRRDAYGHEVSGSSSTTLQQAGRPSDDSLTAAQELRTQSDLRSGFAPSPLGAADLVQPRAGASRPAVTAMARSGTTRGTGLGR